MQHGEGKEQAHDLYVYEHCTFEEVASRTGRSDKTIRNWAEADGWKEERERLFQVRRTTHEKLHVVVDALADRLVVSLNNPEADIPAQSVHALTGLISSLDRLYKYEKAGADAAEASDVSDRQSSPDDIVRKVREILGA